MQEKTFWLDTIEIPAPATRQFPQRVDVAVIGAGFRRRTLVQTAHMNRGTANLGCASTAKASAPSMPASCDER
jgi:hypothetical protein